MHLRESLPARHKQLKGGNSTGEDGGTFVRHNLLYSVWNLIHLSRRIPIPVYLMKHIPLR
jgi:hypothetical protein